MLKRALLVLVAIAAVAVPSVVTSVASARTQAYSGECGPAAGTMWRGWSVCAVGDPPAAVRSSPFWNASVVGWDRSTYNHFLCQIVGGGVTIGTRTNDNWAWAVADDGQRGYVDEIHFVGGGNNSFADLPGCID